MDYIYILQRNLTSASNPSPIQYISFAFKARPTLLMALCTVLSLSEFCDCELFIKINNNNNIINK